MFSNGQNSHSKRTFGGSTTCAGSIVLAGIIIALVSIKLINFEVGPNARNAVDLAVYHNVGKWVLHGFSPYSIYFGTHLHHPLPFTYPPFGAVLLTPLSLLPFLPLAWIWDLSCLLVLSIIVLKYFQPLMQRFGKTRWALLVGVVLLISIFWTRPVRNNLGFGQIDIFLMAMCMADILIENPPWPRGMLIGIGTAMQIAPGIFILYLLLSKRWRPFWTATLTAGLATALGVLAMPSLSVLYFSKLLFTPGRVGNISFFSNQSIWGMLSRVSLGSWHAPLLVIGSALIGVIGMMAAVRVMEHDLKRSVVLIGLVWILVSPITWIHGEVWLIPAIGLMLGDGRSTWKVLLGVFSMIILIFRIKNIDRNPNLVHIPHLIVVLLVDCYGMLAILLLVLLAYRPLSEYFHNGFWKKPVGQGKGDSLKIEVLSALED